MTKLMIAALAATTALATPAMADTDSTTVTATIAPVCTVDGPANATVNLSGSTTLGNVTVTCNDPQGFSASVSSSGNDSHLADSTGNSGTTFDYKLAFGTYGAFALTSPLGFPNSTAIPGLTEDAVDGVAIPVSLQISGQTGASYAGTYSDVITWTVAAN